MRSGSNVSPLPAMPLTPKTLFASLITVKVTPRQKLRQPRPLAVAVPSRPKLWPIASTASISVNLPTTAPTASSAGPPNAPATGGRDRGLNPSNLEINVSCCTEFFRRFNLDAELANPPYRDSLRCRDALNFTPIFSSFTRPPAVAKTVFRQNNLYLLASADRAMKITRQIDTFRVNASISGKQYAEVRL
jgi:hypothetical protein